MRRGNLPWIVSLAAALGLASAGLLSRGSAGDGPPGTCLLVAVVPGLSWEQVLPLRREGRLPGLDRLLAGASWGDVIGEPGDSDEELLASLLTGRHAWRFREGRLAGRAMVPAWRQLERRGDRVLAAGFPPRFDPGANDGRETGARRPADPVPAGEPESLPASCLAADEAAVAAAYAQGHRFVFLGGLSRCRAAARGDEDEERLAADYLVRLDGLLGRLGGAAGNRDVLVIVSAGADADRPFWRRDLPVVPEYPPMGFLLARGPGIRGGTAPVSIGPADLVPTLLYLAGHPVPVAADGRVAFGLLEEDHYFSHPLSFR